MPFLALLSVAATARDVYAAPALLGLGLLVALWARELQHSPARLDRLVFRGSRYLIAIIAWALAGALAVFAAAGAAPWAGCALAAVALLGAAHGATLLAARAERGGDFQRSLGWMYTGYAAALCLAALVVLPIIDRWQDLPGLAQRIHADTMREPLALLDPDETTIAMLDRRLTTAFTVLDAARAAPAENDTERAQRLVGDWFRDEGREARVLVLLPGHAAGSVTLWLGRHLPRAAPAAAADGIAGALISSGVASMVRRYELPQGRRYALLGPPP